MQEGKDTLEGLRTLKLCLDRLLTEAVTEGNISHQNDINLRIGKVESLITQLDQYYAMGQGVASKRAAVWVMEAELAEANAYLEQLTLANAPLEQKLRALEAKNQVSQDAIEVAQTEVAASYERVLVLQDMFQKMLQIAATHVPSNCEKIDPLKFNLETIPAEHLVHTSIVKDIVEARKTELFVAALAKIPPSDINYHNSRGEGLFDYCVKSGFFYGIQKLINAGSVDAISYIDAHPEILPQLESALVGEATPPL